MSCPSAEIGAALRGGGCGPATAPRNWVRVDALDSSRVMMGTPAQVRWVSLSAKDAMGRFGYIKSLAIRGNVVFTAGATNDAVSAHMLRSCIHQIDLMDVSGHKYYAALDGRDIIDDHYYRHGRLPYALAGSIAANLGAAAGYTRQMDIEFALVSRAVGANPLDGLIPIAALQQAPAEAFQFVPRTAFASSPAGITITGYTRPDAVAGLEVWAEVVYLASLPGSPGVPPTIDAPWMLRNYTLQGQDQVLEGEKRKTNYAHIRYRDEDLFGSPSGITGQNLASLIDGMTVEVGGQTYLSALRTLDLVDRGNALRREGVTGFADSADALGLPNLTLPQEASVTHPEVYVLPWRSSEDAPAGPIPVRFATQPATSTRWLHRMTGCDNADRAQEIKAAMGCGCAVRVIPNSQNGSVDGSLPKVLTK